MSWLNDIKNPDSWNYSQKSDIELIKTSKKVDNDFNSHKFRKGEHYDRYLSRLLTKHDMSLSEYYAGHELIKATP